HHLLGHVERFGGEHRAEHADRQVEGVVAEILEVRGVALPEPAVGQGLGLRSEVPPPPRGCLRCRRRAPLPPPAPPAGGAGAPPHPRACAAVRGRTPLAARGASPLSRTPAAIRVKSPFSQSSWFGFMPALRSVVGGILTLGAGLR